MAQTPLCGIRVLDLTNVLSGPFCCHQLAHMGADVIKVEIPGSGDLARKLGADAGLNDRNMGVSFLAQNAGKRSITVNLKTGGGKTLFRKLVGRCDVLVENFRPGVMDRLGVGYESLIGDNPKLIYCAISGFGQDGPLKNLPAYDQIIQGMSGIMGITGDRDSAPLRVGYPVADTIGGLMAAFAIAAQLAAPKREAPCFLDVSLLESALSTMGWVVSNLLIAGNPPLPMGNENFTASPSGTFRTARGLINIAANKQQHFEDLCRITGLEGLISDPRFAKREARLKNRKDLKERLEAALAARTAAQWCPLFQSAGIPSGEVLSLSEALELPQIRDRGLIERFENVPGTDRDIKIAAPGFKIDGKTPRVEQPPPELGAHSRQILGELGYTAEEIEALGKEMAI